MEPKVNIALEAARAGCKELLSFAYRLDQLEIKEKDLLTSLLNWRKLNHN